MGAKQKLAPYFFTHKGGVFMEKAKKLLKSFDNPGYVTRPFCIEVINKEGELEEKRIASGTRVSVACSVRNNDYTSGIACVTLFEEGQAKGTIELVDSNLLEISSTKKGE